VISDEWKTGSVRTNVSVKGVRLTIVALEKQCVTHAVYMSVALGIQLAKRLRRITLSSASCPAAPHFPALSHKRHDLRKIIIEHKIGFWLFQQLLSKTILALRRTERDILSWIYIGVHFKHPLLLSDFNDAWIILTDLTFIGPCIPKIFAEYNQKDATFHNFYISLRCCTCFRRFFRPSSGAQNCTYSVRYLSDQYCCLLLACRG